MTGERDRRYEQLKRRYEALEGRFQQVLAELRSRMTCELVDEVGGVAKLAATCGMDELRVCELMAGERPSALECLLLIAAAQLLDEESGRASDPRILKWRKLTVGIGPIA